jgi:hypothetical protein
MFSCFNFIQKTNCNTNTFSAKNKYGGYTHEIQILPYLVIRLNEVDPNTINIKLIEKRINKKQDSFFLHQKKHVVDGYN